MCFGFLFSGVVGIIMLKQKKQFGEALMPQVRYIEGIKSVAAAAAINKG